MIVNKHEEARRGECLGETLKALFLGPRKPVSHRDSRMAAIPFRQEQPSAEFNSPFRGNPHVELRLCSDARHGDHPARMTLPNGRSADVEAIKAVAV